MMPFWKVLTFFAKKAANCEKLERLSFHLMLKLQTFLISDYKETSEKKVNLRRRLIFPTINHMKDVLGTKRMKNYYCKKYDDENNHLTRNIN